MKLLLNSHVSLDVCLLLVLLPVLSLAHPHVNGSSLRRLYKEMRHLANIARGPFRSDELNTDFRHNFTTLPHITSRAQDLQNLQLNTTLLFIHSGLQSYRFHFDWLQQIKRNRSMTVPSVTQQISRDLRRIGQLLQKQIGDPPPSPVPPQLPTLTSSWDIYVSSIAVHQNLQRFCHWSVMAVVTLMHSPL